MKFHLFCGIISLKALIESVFCICNLGQLEESVAQSSSIYTYSGASRESLDATRALDGRFHNHLRGDCVGTDVELKHKQAWWRITLPNQSRIYKINLVFRENYTRHNGYYVFINKKAVDIKNLYSHPAVYQGDPSSQTIMLFPGGYVGTQMYIFLNKSNENILDICEVEIWGCTENKKESDCKCDLSSDVFPADLLDTGVVFPIGNNNITLRCHSSYINLKTISSHLDKCNFTSECREEAAVLPENISFGCYEVCTNDAYNASYTKLLNPNTPKDYYLKDEKVTLQCIGNRKKIKGHLKRTCLGNLTWSGDEPVCVACRNYSHNENMTELVEPIISKSFFDEGENVSLQCKSKHKLISGELTRTCKGNLTWSGSKLMCKKCKCPCKRLESQNIITNHSVLVQRLEEIKIKLKVKKSKLSSTTRKKSSAPDSRKSAQRIGMALGMGFLITVVCLIVCSDLPLLYRQIKYGPYIHKRLKRRRRRI